MSYSNSILKFHILTLTKIKNKIKEYANSLFNTIDALTFRTSIELFMNSR